jgi:hypothetical protein
VDEHELRRMQKAARKLSNMQKGGEDHVKRRRARFKLSNMQKGGEDHVKRRRESFQTCRREVGMMPM